MSVQKTLGLGLGALALFLGSSACSPKVVVESLGQAGSSTNADAGASGRGTPSGVGGRLGNAGSLGNDPGAAGSGTQLGRLLETDKVDLLFMVDNSVSMADKQALLKDAIPFLMQRLITPHCVDSAGAPAGKPAANGSCPKDSAPEFPAVTDIHLGIVSSSLGAHGGTVCSTPSSATEHLDDKAHLIPSMRSELSVGDTWNNAGFLAWDPNGDRNHPPGESDATTLAKSFQDQIEAIGEHGCGYEASLESWYRFLVDPEPPDTVSLDTSTNSTVRSSSITVDSGGRALIDPATGKPQCTGCDTTLLAQRAAFLRPDSLVAIVMLSDENDCSIRDDGVGWFVGSSSRMPRATEICDTNPNDRCCRSCAQREDTPPGGCLALKDDNVCKNSPSGQAYMTWDALHDSLNLRCYKQHQRFGFDLLYPTSRYVDALQLAQLPLQSNPNVTVTNPLYDAGDSGKPQRDPSLVLLAGIVGVPWQDLADDPSQSGTGLNYLSAAELVSQDRWSYLLGEPDANPPVPPRDPFMIESTDERSGTNQLASPPVAISSAKSTSPKANSINGHEQNIPGLDDLQYACIFPLAQPRECKPGDSCDCSPDKSGQLDAVLTANSPVCQPPAGGAPTSTQYFARAYPGTRELQVLHDVGEMAVVSSICPKLMDTDDVDYGFNPAMNALVDRMKTILRPRD